MKLNLTSEVLCVRFCSEEAVQVQQLACKNSPNELDHPLTVAFCLDHAQRELNGCSASQ